MHREGVIRVYNNKTPVKTIMTENRDRINDKRHKSLLKRERKSHLCVPLRSAHPHTEITEV